MKNRYKFKITVNDLEMGIYEAEYEALQRKLYAEDAEDDSYPDMIETIGYEDETIKKELFEKFSEKLLEEEK